MNGQPITHPKGPPMTSHADIAARTGLTVEQVARIISLGAELDAKAAATAPSYAQTVTRLAREYQRLVDNGEAPPVAYFQLTDRLHAAAAGAGIDRMTSVRDLKDEIEAGPVTAV
jgi:hypothetical protein